MRSLFTTLLACTFAIPALAQGGATAGAYCFSDAGDTKVYVGPAVDTKLNPSVQNDTYPMAREFLDFLKGRYGFTSNSNYPTSCAFAPTPALAEAARTNLRSQMVAQHKEVVEVDWNYTPDGFAAAASFARMGNSPGAQHAFPPPPPGDHGYCVAATAFPGPVYVSEPFDPPQPINIGNWTRAWLQMVGAKYGFKGAIDCSNLSLIGAQRILKAWADGARSGGRQVIETGWKFAAEAPAPTPVVDEDKEPVRAPAGAGAHGGVNTASGDAGAIGRYCRADHLIAAVFDCEKVQKTVLAYEAAHPGTVEPLATLFTGDRLDCTTCIDAVRQRAWVRRTAFAAGLKGSAVTCVEKGFVDRLKAKPYPNRIQEHYDAALAACK